VIYPHQKERQLQKGTNRAETERLHFLNLSVLFYDTGAGSDIALQGKVGTETAKHSIKPIPEQEFTRSNMDHTNSIV
jgi:hypothetical protein